MTHYPNIKKFREALKLKQEFLAAELDIEQSEFSRMENGRRSPKPEELKKLAGIFSVSVDDLIKVSEDQATAAQTNESVPLAVVNRLIEQNERLMEYILKTQKTNNIIE